MQELFLRTKKSKITLWLIDSGSPTSGRTSLVWNFSMDKYIFSVWNPDTVQNKETKCCNKIHGVKENEMWWRLHLPWNGTPRTAKMIPKSFFQFEDPFSIKLGENCRRSKLQHTTYITTRHIYIYCWVVEILWMAVQMSTWLKISILRRRWILPRRKWLGTRPRRTNADEGLIVCMWLAFMDVNIYFLEYGSLIHRGYQPPHLPQGLPSITFGNCIGLDSYK